MKRVLYITRNGLLEPLGYSQVFSYLRGLSNHFEITVVSFEKSRDLSEAKRVAAMEAECASLQVRWIRYAYRALPYIAPAAAMGLLLRHALDGRWGRFDLIHARSQVPALVAMTAGLATSVPYIFDTRGLWVEELIESGVVTRGSAMHAMLSRSEAHALDRAAGIVVLTHAAEKYLSEQHPRILEIPREVIPTCVDLERFTPAAPTQRPRFVFGCVGTVLSGWFDLPRLRDFIEVATGVVAGASVEIVTQESADRVRDSLGLHGPLAEAVSVRSATPDAMPEVMRSHDASLVFYKLGTSQIARSPTRLGEALATGLPVVTNEGVGDVAEVVRRHGVGVVLTADRSRDQLTAAARDIVALSSDPRTRSRCRLAAETEFCLEKGTQRYMSLYTRVLG